MLSDWVAVGMRVRLKAEPGVCGAVTKFNSAWLRVLFDGANEEKNVRQKDLEPLNLPSSLPSTSSSNCSNQHDDNLAAAAASSFAFSSLSSSSSSSSMDDDDSLDINEAGGAANGRLSGGLAPLPDATGNGHNGHYKDDDDAAALVSLDTWKQPQPQPQQQQQPQQQPMDEDEPAPPISLAPSPPQPSSQPSSSRLPSSQPPAALPPAPPLLPHGAAAVERGTVRAARVRAARGAVPLADRLTTPVQGLAVSGVVDLLSGRRALDEFGLAHQALLDCRSAWARATPAPCSYLEGADGRNCLRGSRRPTTARRRAPWRPSPGS